MSEKFTKVAIIYDFDGTLARGNIQENSFIPDLGMDKKEFWELVRRQAEKDEMDEILAYMYLLIEEARKGGTVGFSKERSQISWEKCPLF